MTNFKLTGKWKDALNAMESSFQKSEEALNDRELRKINQGFIDQGYPVTLDNPVSFALNPETNRLEPYYSPGRTSKTTTVSNQNLSISPEALANLKALLGPNEPVPVTNEWLGNKTAAQYVDDSNIQNAGNLLPLMRKLGSRVYKFGEQYADNVPGLSALGEYAEDDSVGTAGALIQAGGRVMPLAGAFWLGINAGPTSAGTLEDARKKGYIK